MHNECMESRQEGELERVMPRQPVIPPTRKTQEEIAKAVLKPMPPR